MTKGEVKGMLTKINELWPGQVKVTEATINAWFSEFEEIPVLTVKRSFKRFMDDPNERGDFPPSPKKLKNHAPEEDTGWKKTAQYWQQRYATDPHFRAHADEYQAKNPDRFVRISDDGQSFVYINGAGSVAR